MVDEIISEIENEQNQRLSMQGMTLEQYLVMSGIDAEEYKNSVIEQAQHRTKARLALEKVVELEGIEVTQDECDEEINRLSGLYNMPFEQIKGLIPPEHLKADLSSRKAISLIKLLSYITEVDEKDPKDQKPKEKKTAKKSAKKDDGNEEIKKDKKPNAKKDAADSDDTEE
jgi:trigger factor